MDTCGVFYALADLVTGAHTPDRVFGAPAPCVFFGFSGGCVALSRTPATSRRSAFLSVFAAAVMGGILGPVSAGLLESQFHDLVFPVHDLLPRALSLLIGYQWPVLLPALAGRLLGGDKPS
jgi:hypothetical protein